MEYLFNSFGISSIGEKKEGYKLTKQQKKAIRKMDEVILTKLSAFFTQWKLKTLLLKGTKQVA